MNGKSDHIVPEEAEFLYSSFYEQLVEHVFISEILQEAWFGRGWIVEILRAEVDASGFDLVLECRGVIRHVQLKTSRIDAKTRSQKVAAALGHKPSGCVVWVLRTTEGSRIKLRYRYFGGLPGEPLPDLTKYKMARTTKADTKGVKKERPGIRVVPRSDFANVGSMAELLDTFSGRRAVARRALTTKQATVRVVVLP